MIKNPTFDTDPVMSESSDSGDEYTDATFENERLLSGSSPRRSPNERDSHFRLAWFALSLTAALMLLAGLANRGKGESAAATSSLYWWSPQGESGLSSSVTGGERQYTHNIPPSAISYSTVPPEEDSFAYRVLKEFQPSNKQKSIPPIFYQASSVELSWIDIYPECCLSTKSQGYYYACEEDPSMPHCDVTPLDTLTLSFEHDISVTATADRGYNEMVIASTSSTLIWKNRTCHFYMNPPNPELFVHNVSLPGTKLVGSIFRYEYYYTIYVPLESHPDSCWFWVCEDKDLSVCEERFQAGVKKVSEKEFIAAIKGTPNV